MREAVNAEFLRLRPIAEAGLSELGRAFLMRFAADHVAQFEPLRSCGDKAVAAFAMLWGFLQAAQFAEFAGPEAYQKMAGTAKVAGKAEAAVAALRTEAEALPDLYRKALRLDALPAIEQLLHSIRSARPPNGGVSPPRPRHRPRTPPEYQAFVLLAEVAWGSGWGLSAGITRDPNSSQRGGKFVEFCETLIAGLEAQRKAQLMRRRWWPATASRRARQIENILQPQKSGDAASKRD